MVFVGFSTPRRWNPLSALIRAMTRSRTSHTWLLVEDPVFQLRLVLEAHATGFRLVSFARFVKENRVVALVVPAHPVAPGLPAAGEWLGERFDVLGLCGIFLTLVARWFRQRPWRNPFPTPSALFCSEAVIRTLEAAAYPGISALGDETTTPAELLAFFERDGESAVVAGKSLRLWSHLRRAGDCPPPRGGDVASSLPSPAAGPDPLDPVHPLSGELDQRESRRDPTCL